MKKSRSIHLAGLALAGSLMICPHAHAGINSWTVVGPEGGSTISVGIHPTQPDTVFAQVGGLFQRSTDAGVHWTYTPGSPAGSGSRVVFDPANSNLMYIGADRIYRSTDGGQNFTALAGPAVTSGILKIAMAADGAVYVTDFAAHLFRSLDQGATWVALSGPWPTNSQLSTIDADPNNPARLYASSYNGSLYRSEDRGLNWTALTNSPAFLGGGLSSLAIQPGNSDRILAASEGAGYAVSQNRGATWSFFSTTEWNMWVGFDPITPANAVRLTRDGRVYRSADGGLTWPAPSNGQSLDVSQALSAAFSPSQSGRIIFATTEGPFLSNNGGATSTARFAGLHAAYPSAFAAADDGTLYEANLYGPYGIFRRGSNGWTPLNNAGLRAQVAPYIRIDSMAVSASNSSVIYVISQNSDVVRSLDGGATWSSPAAEFASGTNRFPEKIAVDPSTPDIAYIATYSDGLWKTINRGVSWTKLTSLLPTRVDQIGISPFDPQTIYVAARDTASVIYKSTNGGASWAPTAMSRNGDFQGFTFDPVDSQTVYAFGGDVNRTTNGGASWTQLDFGPPNGAFQRAQAMLVDPLHSSTLWVVGQQDGRSMLRSTDGGAHWESIALEVPQGDIFVAFDKAALDPLNPSLIHVGATLLGIVDFEVAPDMFVTFQGLGSPIPADSTSNTEVLIANTGPHDSSPGEARVALPSFIHVTPPSGCTLNGAVLACPYPAQRVGQIYSLPLTLTVDAEPASAPIQVAITPHETDPIAANNVDARGVQSTRQAPIVLEYIDTVPSAAHNDSVVFVARITNPGPSRARDVQLSLATGTLKVASATDPHDACTHSIDAVTCAFGRLEANSSVMVTVEAQVSALGENTVDGTASREGDDAEAIYSSGFSIVGRPLADFSIQASAPVSAAPGAAVSYTFTVQNNGPDPATSQAKVTLTGATASGAVTTGGTCSLAGAVFTCSLNSLGSGASTTITVSATAAGSGSASAAGSVIGGGVDRSSANDSASGVTSIVAPTPPKKSGGGGRFDWLALALSGLLGLRRIRIGLASQDSRFSKSQAACV